MSNKITQPEPARRWLYWFDQSGTDQEKQRPFYPLGAEYEVMTRLASLFWRWREQDAGLLEHWTARRNAASRAIRVSRDLVRLLDELVTQSNTIKVQLEMSGIAQRLSQDKIGVSERATVYPLLRLIAHLRDVQPVLRRVAHLRKVRVENDCNCCLFLADVYLRQLGWSKPREICHKIAQYINAEYYSTHSDDDLRMIDEHDLKARIKNFRKAEPVYAVKIRSNMVPFIKQFTGIVDPFMGHGTALGGPAKNRQSSPGKMG